MTEETPIENGVVTLSDDEFQFFKLKLQNNVKEYLNLDEQILALRKGLKERNIKKKEMSNEILEIMKNLGIDNLNVKDGRLVSKTTKQNKAISKHTLIDGLSSLFKNDNEQIENALKTILEKREKVEKTSLKLYKNKKKSIVLE